MHYALSIKKLSIISTKKYHKKPQKPQKIYLLPMKKIILLRVSIHHFAFAKHTN